LTLHSERRTPPALSVIIPSWTGDVSRLRDSLERQTFRDFEVHVVQGVSPAARARNLGAERAQADILLFVDDDAFLGSENVLQTLYDLIRQDEQTAVVGTSKIVPPTGTPLQRAIAWQVPRMEQEVVPQTVESNPPIDTYGFTAITTTCCAIRRSVFEEVGGFDESLPTGPEDTDFFYRVRRLGYRFILAANCWVYHDPPASLSMLLRKSFAYGVGHAWEARKTPERTMALLPLDRWYGKLALLASVPAFVPSLFLHVYFEPVRHLVVGFRPLKTLSTYAVLLGYALGWQRFGRPLTPASTYMGKRAAGSRD